MKNYYQTGGHRKDYHSKMSYIDSIDNRIKDYFDILEPEFPLWLHDYINTKELLKQQYISVSCGTIYSDMFDSNFFYSSLDHSIGVALIVWHFTHDKKQTLAGLFHDIATPVFKHSIDFLNGDYMVQESTEIGTSKLISDSNEIMSLLKRDNITLQEVEDYRLYSVADNDTPKLSADRLEYSLSNALFMYNLARLDNIKEIYNDLVITKDETGADEIAFCSKDIAIEFVKLTSKLSILYRADKTRYSMQFIADIIKKLYEMNIIIKEDLYTNKESEIINIIDNSKFGKYFELWKKSSNVQISEDEPKGVYYVHHGAKIRYIDPLVKGKRISKISEIANEEINNNLSYNMNNYIYIEGIEDITKL